MVSSCLNFVMQVPNLYRTRNQTRPLSSIPRRCTFRLTLSLPNTRNPINFRISRTQQYHEARTDDHYTSPHAASCNSSIHNQASHLRLSTLHRVLGSTKSPISPPVCETSYLPGETGINHKTLSASHSARNNTLPPDHTRSHRAQPRHENQLAVRGHTGSAASGSGAVGGEVGWRIVR